MIKIGIVKSVDRTHARGELECENEVISFSLTSFHSGRPKRHPRRGESVEVVFSLTRDDEYEFLFVRPPRRSERGLIVQNGERLPEMTTRPE